MTEIHDAFALTNPAGNRTKFDEEEARKLTDYQNKVSQSQQDGLAEYENQGAKIIVQLREKENIIEKPAG